MRTAIALAVFVIGVHAAELNLEAGTLSPGKAVSLDLKLAAGTEGLTGIQFDLEYDAAFLEIAVDGGPAATQAGKSLRAARIAAGKQRVLIIGFNQNVLADGVLAKIRVTSLRPAAGKTFPIVISGASATNRKAEMVPVTSKDGKVRVESEGNPQ